MAWVLMGGLDLRVPSEVSASQAPGRSCPWAALLILSCWPPCPALWPVPVSSAFPLGPGHPRGKQIRVFTSSWISQAHLSLLYF